MDDQFGLQKAETPIPKLTDGVREKIEVSEERRLDPQRQLIEDALSKLSVLLDDWDSVWIAPPWRSQEAIVADNSERPGRVRVRSDGTVIIGEGARNLRVLVATEQLPVFQIIDNITKDPHLHSPFSNTHKRGRPYLEGQFYSAEAGELCNRRAPTLLPRL